MAKKNQVAAMAAMSAMALGPVSGEIVAFMLVDHQHGEGDDAEKLFAGQRIEIDEETFAEMAKENLCEKGVYVKMLTGVEGKKYSLIPNQNTWLPVSVYDAWKAVGYCEPTDDDPSVTAKLQARADDVRELTKARDDALARVAELESQLQALALEHAAAGAQVRSFVEVCEPVLKDAGKTFDPVKSGLAGLLAMFPEESADVDNGAPELKLT